MYGPAVRRKRYDWVGQWYHSFSVMLSEIHRISGIPEAELKQEIRAIHQKFRTSEFAFLIENLITIRAGSVEDTVKKFQPAIDRFREARKQHLALYPSIVETLNTLKRFKKTLVVFTESQTFYTSMRFKKLGLEGLVDFLFTSDDHETPDSNYLASVRKHPPGHYEIMHTRHRSVGWGRLKPDPEILRAIVKEIGATEDNTIYVGDSLYKDVAMAKDANILAVWAEYGEARGQPGYDLLREVSHWTDGDVQADRVLKKRDIIPDAILYHRFDELLNILGLEREAQNAQRCVT
jgi:FMN phosphatase YigB (HAD superfamily)